jgi:hypothetical protein
MATPAGLDRGKNKFHYIAQNNAIWIRFQGASKGANSLYVPFDATPITDSKTSPARAAVEFIFSSALTCWEAVGLCGYRYFA